ncbi:MAG TPA: 16S rRNA (uracil(1498)-N(3))-methyltransferase [Pseudomonadales bacterium]|nr:16S rRNA (uracil(1498)-N(3))-methyltransferase [Pseudomonadales bacterium]
MRISRIYIDMPLQTGSELSLPSEAAHHLAVVLRMKAGQPVILFNNTGAEARAVIVQVDKKQVGVHVDSVAQIERESPLNIHLAIGISRGERMDFVLQKSTELGVHAITPLFCERTEVKLQQDRLQKKMEQWKKIVIGACEQSGRTRLPLLHTPATLATCLASDTSVQRFVLHHRSDSTLAQCEEKPRSILLLIGPEGGLSDTEIQQAQQAGCTALTLGARVLRTETAPLAAISVLQYRWGDFR